MDLFYSQKISILNCFFISEQAPSRLLPRFVSDVDSGIRVRKATITDHRLLSRFDSDVDSGIRVRKVTIKVFIKEEV